MRRASVAAAAVLGIVLAAGPPFAALPQTISFQGKLADSAGTPVTAAASIVFSLHDAATGGTQAWSETHAGVTPGAEGVFSAVLGATTTFASAGVDFSQPLWLQVEVDSEVLSPRFALAAVPYAFNADTVDGADASAFFDKATHDADVNEVIDAADTAAVAADADTLDGVDSTAFALLAGRAGGQDLAGGTAAGEDLTLQSTADATKGDVVVVCENLVAGHSGNSVTGGVLGGTVSGGGASSYDNIATDNYCTVGGGHGNQAGDDAGTTSDNSYCTVAGGSRNTATSGAAIAGGSLNTASGNYAFVGAGALNTASGGYSVAGGGNSNTASGFYSTVGGGAVNYTAAHKYRDMLTLRKV